MLPYLLVEATTWSGDTVELVYGKWLSMPIKGLERQALPLPASFKLFQWEHVPRLGIGEPLINEPINFGVLPVQQISHVVPIVQIGSLPQAFGSIASRHAACRALRAHALFRRQSLPENPDWPWEQLRNGPLFALNVHAYL